jgi:hypothetical protein
MNLLWLRIATIFFVLGSIAQTASGQLASNSETLQGHSSVFLSISTPEIDQTGRNVGLKKESLERFVLGRLEKSGIKVSTTFTNQTLILQVHVDLVKVIQSGETDVYAFISRFEAIQAARLATNRQSALATTWKATKFGAVTRQQANLLRDSVVQNLDQFIAAWTDVNATVKVTDGK